MALKNFGYGTVATAPSPATTGKSLVLTTGHGARFPAAPFPVVIWPSGSQPLDSNAEVVMVTAVSTDTFTIRRGEDGSTARTIVAGDQVALAPTVQMFKDFRRGNYSALSHWYGELAGREDIDANVVFYGDSVTEGYQALSKDRSYVRRYGDALQRMFRPGGTGFVPVGVYLSGWTLTGGTLLTAGFGLANYSYSISQTTQTAQYTFTGDRCIVYFTGGSGTATAAITIDGVAAGTVNTNNPSTLTIYKFDSGQLVRGTHTVSVTTQTNGTSILVDGIQVFDTDYGKGIHIWEAGHSGYLAGSIVSTDGHWLYFTSDVIDPDLVFIQFGLNDQWMGTSKATYKANINGIIDQVYTKSVKNPSVVLLGIWARADTIVRSDASTTSGSAVVTSAGATFQPGVVGMQYEGSDFPAGTLVASRQSATQITMSANATVTGTNRTVTLRYTDDQWQPYRQAMTEVARERNVLFFDLYELAGWLGTADSVEFGDGVVSGTSLTSSRAYFTGRDVGKSISGPGIAAGATITSYNSTTNVTMSAAGTNGNTKFTITDRIDPQSLTTDLLHPSEKGMQWIADELSRLTAGLPRLSNIPQGIFDNAGEMIIAETNDKAKKVPGVKKKTADQTFSTTSFADVTDLSFPIGPGETLQFQFDVFWQSTATTNGIGLAINGPASPTALRYAVEVDKTVPAVPTAATSVKSFSTTYDSGIVTQDIDAANTQRHATVRGVIKAGTLGGTVSLRARSEVTTGGANVQILSGSFGIIL